MTIEEHLARRSRLIEPALEELLADPERHIEPRLLEAMRYSLLSGGKRLRPVLLLDAVEAVGGNVSRGVPFACAVEMVHTYSLIHDDLPAMDDDPVRRGKPSCHVVFGEAVAILAGDALLTEAFAVLSLAGELCAERRVRVIAELANAIGARGMVGGQAADILAEGVAAEAERVRSIHRRKTGALLAATVQMGGLVGGADRAALESLTRYGEALGLAFQIADDVLDEVGRSDATGKEAGRDRERGKSTYPAALGLTRSRRLLHEQLDQALAAIQPLGGPAEPLRTIGRFVVGRAL